MQIYLNTLTFYLFPITTMHPESIDMCKLALQIRQCRLEKNYKQEVVALELKISQSTYSDIENGKIEIKAIQLYKLANFLDKDIADFFVDSNSTPPIKLLIMCVL